MAVTFVFYTEWIGVGPCPKQEEEEQHGCLQKEAAVEGSLSFVFLVFLVAALEKPHPPFLKTKSLAKAISRQSIKKKRPVQY